MLLAGASVASIPAPLKTRLAALEKGFSLAREPRSNLHQTLIRRGFEEYRKPDFQQDLMTAAQSGRLDAFLTLSAIGRQQGALLIDDGELMVNGIIAISSRAPQFTQLSDVELVDLGEAIVATDGTVGLDAIDYHDLARKIAPPEIRPSAAEFVRLVAGFDGFQPTHELVLALYHFYDHFPHQRSLLGQRIPRVARNAILALGSKITPKTLAAIILEDLRTENTTVRERALGGRTRNGETWSLNKSVRDREKTTSLSIIGSLAKAGYNMTPVFEQVSDALKAEASLQTKFNRYMQYFLDGLPMPDDPAEANPKSEVFDACLRIIGGNGTPTKPDGNH